MLENIKTNFVSSQCDVLSKMWSEPDGFCANASLPPATGADPGQVLRSEGGKGAFPSSVILYGLNRF